MARQRREDRGGRFEWRVVRIPLTVFHIVLILAVLVVGGFLLYHFRARLPLDQLRLPQVVRVVLETFGFDVGGSGSDQGGNEENLIEQRFATIAFLSGEVKVQRAREMEWFSGREKTRVTTGDRVRTFGGSRAEILFDDGSVLKIKPDSLIIIGDLMENVKTKVRKSSVKLMVSSIEADIKKSVVAGSQFRLEMPSAVAEMGKANVSVQVGPGKDSQIKVFSGNVNVDTGREQLSMNDSSRVTIGPGSEISSVLPLMPVPRMTAPRNLTKFIFNDVGQVTVALKWERVKEAAGYHLVVANDMRFQRPALDRTQITETSFTASGLAQGVYYARVSAADLTGEEGGFSEPAVFMVTLDRTPPRVNILKFVSSRAPGGYDVYVEGTTEPTARIELAGRSMVVDDEGRFSGSLRGIASGAREIPLVGTDRAGNRTALPLKVTGQ